MSDQQVIVLDDASLSMLLSKAAHAGAQRALQEIGLGDDGAMHDVRELRSLLDTWRSFKSTVRRTVWQTLTRWALYLLVVILVYAVGWHRAGPVPFWINLLHGE